MIAEAVETDVEHATSDISENSGGVEVNELDFLDEVEAREADVDTFCEDLSHMQQEALFPGPAEPQVLQTYLLPLVQELLVLWHRGVEVVDVNPPAHLPLQFRVKAMLIACLHDYPGYDLMEQGIHEELWPIMKTNKKRKEYVTKPPAPYVFMADEIDDIRRTWRPMRYPSHFGELCAKDIASMQPFRRDCKHDEVYCACNTCQGLQPTPVNVRTQTRHFQKYGRMSNHVSAGGQHQQVHHQASYNVEVYNAPAATVEVNVQETVQHHAADVSSNTWEEEPAALPTSSWVDSMIAEAVETDVEHATSDISENSGGVEVNELDFLDEVEAREADVDTFCEDLSHMQQEALFPGTILLPAVITGKLQPRQRATLTKFCDALACISAPWIPKSQAALDGMELDLLEALCLLERDFPRSVFTISTHLVLHSTQQLRRCGPVRGTWMFGAERRMQHIRKQATSRKAPEASIVVSQELEEINMCGSKALRLVWPFAGVTLVDPLHDTPELLGAPSRRNLTEQEVGMINLYVKNNNKDVETLHDMLDSVNEDREHKRRKLRRTHGKAKRTPPELQHLDPATFLMQYPEDVQGFDRTSLSSGATKEIDIPSGRRYPIGAWCWRFLLSPLSELRVKWFKKPFENGVQATTDTGRFWVERQKFFRQDDEPYIEANRIVGQVFFVPLGVKHPDTLMVLEKEVANRASFVKSVRVEIADPDPPPSPRREVMTRGVCEATLREARKQYSIGAGADTALAGVEEERLSDSDLEEAPSDIELQEDDEWVTRHPAQ
eukprot:jgi/Chlat1/2415/Chrsp17S02667